LFEAIAKSYSDSPFEAKAKLCLAHIKNKSQKG